MKLDHVHAVCGPITGEIFIARFDSKERETLEKLPAERSVLTAVIEHMMHGSPKGATKEIRIGDQWYSMTVKPCEAPTRQPDASAGSTDSGRDE